MPCMIIAIDTPTTNNKYLTNLVKRLTRQVWELTMEKQWSLWRDWNGTFCYIKFSYEWKVISQERLERHHTGSSRCTTVPSNYNQCSPDINGSLQEYRKSASEGPVTTILFLWQVTLVTHTFGDLHTIHYVLPTYYRSVMKCSTDQTQVGMIWVYVCVGIMAEA